MALTAFQSLEVPDAPDDTSFSLSLREVPHGAVNLDQLAGPTDRTTDDPCEFVVAEFVEARRGRRHLGLLGLGQAGLILLVLPGAGDIHSRLRHGLPLSCQWQPCGLR